MSVSVRSLKGWKRRCVRAFDRPAPAEQAWPLFLARGNVNVGFVFNALNLGQVSAGGDNFSSGERQLLCLARSILPYHEAPAGAASAVLICDEVRTVLSIGLEG